MKSAKECDGNVSEIEEQISAATLLPTQPSALPQLLQAVGDADVDICKLAKILERFPSILARLVALANSAWAAPVEPITSIEHACAHLGLRLVRTVSISLAMIAPFDPTRCCGFDSGNYWCNTFLVADSAAQLTARARIGQNLSPDTARAAGLFYNLGFLWLADNMPVATARAMSLAQRDGIDLNDSLRNCCGTDACRVGGLLGRAWGLPDDLVAAMEHRRNLEYDGNGWQVAALVQVAAGIVGAVTRGDQKTVIDGNLDRLAIDQNDCDEILAEMAAKLDATLELARTLKL